MTVVIFEANASTTPDGDDIEGGRGVVSMGKVIVPETVSFEHTLGAKGKSLVSFKHKEVVVHGELEHQYQHTDRVTRLHATIAWFCGTRSF